MLLMITVYMCTCIYVSKDNVTFDIQRVGVYVVIHCVCMCVCVCVCVCADKPAFMTAEPSEEQRALAEQARSYGQRLQGEDSDKVGGGGIVLWFAAFAAMNHYLL